MKKICLSIGFCAIAFCSFAQNNSNPWPTVPPVGIGTASPTSTLEVAAGTGSSANGIVISQGNSGGNVASGRLFFSNAGDITTNSFGIYKYANALQFSYAANPGSSSGTTGLVMTNTGSVGIGTGSPVSTLQVGGTTGSNFITLSGGYTGSSYGINYTFNTPGTNIYAQQMFDYDNRATRGLQFNSLSSYGFSFNNISTTGVYANNLLTILGSGLVGIGTATPHSLAHLYKAAGSAVLSIENTGTGNSSGISFIRERASGTGIPGATIFMNSNTADNNALLYIQAQTIAPQSAQTDPLTARNGARIVLRGGTAAISFENGAAETMRIDSNGNVGIATIATKGYKLAVNGSAIATAMWVKLYANWPDYVFKADYHLPTLNEVKTYIDANHHLSDVPTEQDVKQNGLNLGEMNRVLVKKVEELTLYMIELSKQIKEEHDVNKSLQKQIDLIKQAKQ